MTQARSELIESRGGNAFMEDSLPRAVIRFKQGFGRLIRSKSDRGRVVVLDDRIIRARYGRVFLSALPAGVRVRVVGQDGE
jgi:ATP-dependent DNA helicase DinG